MAILRAKTKRTLTLLFICCFCLLTLVPSIECIFKILKKKKFMEGFLVGFVVGNEYAGHKSPSPKPDFYSSPMSGLGGPMSQLGGMGLGGSSYLGHHPYMPRKSDRSYRRSFRPARLIKRRSRRGRVKKTIKFPVYIRKSH